MIISILTDNVPGNGTSAEHGLSYLVEHDGKKVLFDTGQSDLFYRNASTMGLSLDHPDAIVLSHGHFDHGGGMRHLKGGDLICHPGCFAKRYRKPDHSYIGLKLSEEEIAAKFNLIRTTEPFAVSDRIIFLGEVPRLTDFESTHTNFVLEDGSDDYVMDDSAIALIADQGLFVITGCGHAGIVNTLEHARVVTGINQIYGVMGGFHLKRADHQTRETIRYLKGHQVPHVLPSHCTAGPALELFFDSFGSSRVRTGDRLTL
jgi:7,8-dihydropterin-6-yl-methyl-4-(beta-D-ribofuranosyl)aminobenzene 5'-phosphate synthase